MTPLAYFMFDPMYFVFIAPAILLGLAAQAMVRSAYAKGKRVAAQSGLSGAETAQRILNEFGINDVGIEPTKSWLGDHYDPRRKVLRLSPDVYHGRTLTSLGIAAHEVGHAIQDATSYTPLVLRNGLVPIASIGSNAAFLMVIVGSFLAWQGLAIGGLALFGVVVLFQLINLPVEFNASSRARQILLSHGMVTQSEDRVVGKVLNAAAMTYVAATIMAILQFAYFAYVIFGRRN